MSQFESSDPNKVIVITFDPEEAKKHKPAWGAKILVRQQTGNVIVSDARPMYDEEYIVAEVTNYEREVCGHRLTKVTQLPPWTDATLNELDL